MLRAPVTDRRMRLPGARMTRAEDESDNVCLQLVYRESVSQNSKERDEGVKWSCEGGAVS